MAENDKNRLAIFIIFRQLSGAKRRSIGVIELTLTLRDSLHRKPSLKAQSLTTQGFYL